MNTNQRQYFTVLDLPYLNDLTANQLGVAARFDANDPISFLGQSLTRLNQFAQKPVQDKIEVYENIQFPSTDDNLEIDIRTGKAVPRGSSSQDEWLRDQGVPMQIPPDTTKQMGIDPNYKSDCSTFDLPCHITSALGVTDFKDVVKRAGILIVAILLGYLAIKSL